MAATLLDTFKELAKCLKCPVCCVEQDSPDLLLLLRMLCLGQGAWDMIDSQVFKEPRLVSSAVAIRVSLLTLLLFFRS